MIGETTSKGVPASKARQQTGTLRVSNLYHSRPTKSSHVHFSLQLFFATLFEHRFDLPVALFSL